MRTATSQAAGWQLCKLSVSHGFSFDGKGKTKKNEIKFKRYPLNMFKRIFTLIITRKSQLEEINEKSL